MNSESVPSEILIVGAGPAGLAAAASAATSGAQIDIIDENFQSGGQIWRGGAATNPDPRARALWENLHIKRNVRFHFQTRVVHAISAHELVAESAGKTLVFQAQKLILASGARELLLPFPGWTLPGVIGAGGLQALCKNGFPVAGKRIVLAGSGPLLLAATASLVERGAIVTHILEQAKPAQLGRFTVSLLATPGKILQAWQLAKNLRKTNYSSNSYVLSAQGEHQVTSVQVQIKGKQHTIACDYLACGFGLLPNIELAAALGCALERRQAHASVKVDQWQCSSLAELYVAGEGTGVGGVDLALAEGNIAGLAAVGWQDQARALFGERARWQAFARRLQKAFVLRPELGQLCAPDTQVCRCEDVSFAQLQGHQDWRSAKLQTRCGMGACQGRVCGAATEFLFGWGKESGRQPFAAAQIGSLCQHKNSPSEARSAD